MGRLARRCTLRPIWCIDPSVVYITCLYFAFRPSIIIFSLDLLGKFLKTAHDQVAILALHSPIIAGPHHLHDLLLSAALEGGLVVDPVAEVTFIELSHLRAFLLGVSAQCLAGILSEEVVAMEQPVEVYCCCAHPQRSHSTEPPGIGLHDEVGVVEHTTESMNI